MSAKKLKSISTSIFWVASLLFFVSGGTGLAYQVVWFKRFAHVWGSSSLAFAAVGASFLFGLGLGAYLLGRVADRLQSPLRWYALSELAIGALALVIPFEIAALVEASAGIYARIPTEPVLRFLMQSVITLLVIGPPCVLMGGTLPLLIRQLTTRDGSLDQVTGWLYAINTFGAATGCYLTGFHLLPAWGLLGTNQLTAGINGAIGLVALVASGSVARMPTPKPAAPTAAAEGTWQVSLLALYVATAASGAGALMMEMAWTRQLALVLGGSTYAFSATLFVVLLGIACGSLVYQNWLRSWTGSVVVAPAVVLGLLLTAIAGSRSLPWLASAVSSEQVQQWRGQPFGNGLVCVGASMVVEFLPSLAMGILFPMFVALTQAGAARVGRAVGNIYAWNTLGSIVGASFTALLLFPAIGTQGAVALAGGCYLAALLLVLPWRAPRGVSSGVGSAVVGAGLLALLALPTDPRLTNMGMYMYGDPGRASADRPANPDWLSKIETLFFREGASSNVFVTHEAGTEVSLRVNGKVDATSGPDMVTQLGLAYFPRMFKHDAQDVMVIGFGSGCTSGKCLLFPETRVTCCEIEPAVYEATDYFAAFNDRPHEKSLAWLEQQNSNLPESERRSPEELEKEARFSLILGDGRTAIQGSPHKFDLIISEPSNPWLAGVSNLFTREFFRAARARLKPKGVLAQWIQTYDFTIEDYLVIVRTLRTEFKHFGVIMLMGGSDTILLASDEPLMPGNAELDQLQTLINGVPRIKSDLESWFGGSDVRYLLMQHYLLSEAQLTPLVDRDHKDILNTDLHLTLEFDAPLHLFRKLPEQEKATFMLLKAVNVAWLHQLGNHLGRSIEQADVHVTMGDYLVRQLDNPWIAVHLRKLGQLQRATANYQAAMKIDPGHAGAKKGLERLAILSTEQANPLKALEEIVQLNPTNATARGKLAEALLERRQWAKAIEQLREALRLTPELSSEKGSLMWANNLAWLLATNADATLRNGPEAVQWARKACAADRNQTSVLQDTLAAALAENGEFAEAIEVCQRVIDAPGTPEQIAASMRSRIALYRQGRAYREP